MSFELTTLFFLAAILLLPLFPAYILYKNLPSETVVKGPFKGLNIQLTGSFGGYFLLVLFSSGFLSLQQSQQTSTMFHYNIIFPSDGFPQDISDTDVNVYVKKAGKDTWILHEDFEKKPSGSGIGSGIMISVTNIYPQDTLYINAKYQNNEWETEKSVTVPVDHLLLKPGHERGAFNR